MDANWANENHQKMSKLQQLLNDRWPISEEMPTDERYEYLALRRAYSNGYYACLKEIQGVLSDIIELADFGYSARCASNHPRNETAISLRSLNRAKAVIEEANK